VRVFLLPSWCPTVDTPLSGTFFVEQAHALARLRSHWSIAICLFDLARSRVPWRPSQMSRFAHDFAQRPRVSHEIAASGLHVYQVWKPYLPRWGARKKWQATVMALSAQARPALAQFTTAGGKPDLIHALASYPAGGAAAILGRESRIPFGITEHLGPFPPHTLQMADGRPMAVIDDAYAAATGLSAVSRSLAEQILRWRLAPHVDVLPNFLDDDFGAAALADDRRAPGFSFLSVGGPSQEKGTGNLLRALALSRGGARLQIVGDGVQRPEFQRLAVALGIADRVSWLGATTRENMPNVYAASDAVVLASQSETFGVVLIEALACGKPLIATRCGGPLDIVRPANGLLVPVDDAASLAAAMDRMQESVGQYAAQALHADFLQRFSASAAVDGIERWYGMLRERGSAGAQEQDA